MCGVVEPVGGSGAPDLARLRSERIRTVQDRDRLVAEYEQRRVDGEVRATRRALTRGLRRHGGADAAAFLDEDFLAVADRPSVYQAILDAAVSASGAGCVDLQLYDHRAGVLRMVAQHGFTSEFLAFFGIVDTAQPTACAAACVAREPVLVDDVGRSPIFAGQPTLEPLLAAGSRAVHSYPLLDAAGDVLGTLSFHHGTRAADPGKAELVARGAAQVLGKVP